MKQNFKPGLITISAALSCALAYAIYEHKKAAGGIVSINYGYLALSAGAGYAAGSLIAAFD